jgi:solute carrier family 45 protein 1/2/4
MEYLKEVDDRGKTGDKQQAGAQLPPAYTSAPPGRPGHARAASTPVVWNPPSAPANERTSLVRSFSLANIDDLNEEVDYAGSKPAGGTIMGIHNLAIVFPQVSRV